MASIPTNGYAEVMAGTNNYSGSNSYDGSCPRTAIPPVIGDDLTNKTYVDAATGGGILSTLTDKGSLLTANGTTAVIFAENPYQTAITTITVYDWNSLAIGQSRDFTTTSPTPILLGAGITITYSGTDSIKGNVTAVVGTTITLTITTLAHAVYTPTTLLTTLAPLPVGFAIAPGNTVLAVTPDITTPNPPDIPANTIITQGAANVYSYAVLPPTNFFITLSGTNVVRGVSNTIAPAPPTGTSSGIDFDGANGGCFFGSTQTPVITVNLTAGGLIAKAVGSDSPDFVGSLFGYTLSYGTGSIVIDEDIALIADATSATGLAWGAIIPVITDTNTNATYYPTFVAGSGKQALLADIATGPISLNPSNGNFNVVDTLKLTQTQVAVGKSAGITSQGVSAVAIGFEAGKTNQDEAVAIGFQAGTTDQGIYAVAIGSEAGLDTQGQASVAIGFQAGTTDQDDYSVAIGYEAGKNTQGQASVAIGNGAGAINQGGGGIAIGFEAGTNDQDDYSVAIGYEAGYDTQGEGCIAIGRNAGKDTQGDYCIAIGDDAGKGVTTSQGTNSVAIGRGAGKTSQDQDCVAIGYNAGGTQDEGAIAIGFEAGQSNQGQVGVAIGYKAGKTNQSLDGVAIGSNAGNNGQGEASIAIGVFAGTNQLLGSVAIGDEAGLLNQGQACVAIGFNAGKNNQGQDAIAIGSNAGTISQSIKSICINASGAALQANQQGLFIAPIRPGNAGSTFTPNLPGNVLYYNSTGEIQYTT